MECPINMHNTGALLPSFPPPPPPNENIPSLHVVHIPLMSCWLTTFVHVVHSLFDYMSSFSFLVELTLETMV